MSKPSECEQKENEAMNSAVCEAELSWIKTRRSNAKLEEGAPLEDSVGLGLSGGGVRSATFNLGFLQALSHYNIFRRVDYLSTVSGGGYVGSTLTWLMSHDDKRFPFGSSRTDHNQLGGRIVTWLRQHGCYLTPGNNGLNQWALAAAIARGIAINLAIIVPLFFLGMFLIVNYPVDRPEFMSYWSNNVLSWVFLAGLCSFASLIVGFGVYALLSNAVFSHKFRSKMNAWLGRILKFGCMLCGLGSVPVVAMYFIQKDLVSIGGELSAMNPAIDPTTILNTLSSLSSDFGALSISGTGVVAFLISWLSKNISNPRIVKYRGVLVTVGLAFLCYGLLVWLYQGAFMWAYQFETNWKYMLIPGVPISVALGLIANINHVSMHRYYRDRLLDAYLPKDASYGEMQDASQCLLKDIKPSASPYHIINTNFITVDSRTPILKSRGSENFIFSPLFCGSDHTQYLPTKQYIKGKMDLATAFSISGAAVDPNTGITRSRPMALLMALLNIRLGYWIRNPAVAKKWLPEISRPLWYIYMLREMFGVRMDESHRYIHLSDGGHFENLGLYELVRRRCKYIIISDAGADPDWIFGDLANACEKVRVDFGAKIEIDTQALHPDKDSGMSDFPCVPGKVHYVNGDVGHLLFVKTTLIPGLSEDIYGYARGHDAFPDQTTADQFFDEAQFEAYRELGYQIGRSVFEAYKYGNFENAFNLFRNGNKSDRQPQTTPDIKLKVDEKLMSILEKAT